MESLLRDKFQVEVLRAIDEARSLGYAPTEFERMLSNRHAVEVAKHLVISGDVQSGFNKLVSMGRQDLTIESLMLQPDFKSLFDERTHLAVARWRLDLPQK